LQRPSLQINKEEKKEKGKMHGKEEAQQGKMRRSELHMEQIMRSNGVSAGHAILIKDILDLLMLTFVSAC
jgi:hypothetical protein